MSNTHLVRSEGFVGAAAGRTLGVSSEMKQLAGQCRLLADALLEHQPQILESIAYHVSTQPRGRARDQPIPFATSRLSGEVRLDAATNEVRVRIDSLAGQNGLLEELSLETRRDASFAQRALNAAIQPLHNEMIGAFGAVPSRISAYDRHQVILTFSVPGLARALSNND